MCVTRQCVPTACLSKKLVLSSCRQQAWQMCTCCQVAGLHHVAVFEPLVLCEKGVLYNPVNPFRGLGGGERPELGCNFCMFLPAGLLRLQLARACLMDRHVARGCIASHSEFQGGVPDQGRCSRHVAGLDCSHAGIHSCASRADRCPMLPLLLLWFV
jgi:hypothetical protein